MEDKFDSIYLDGKSYWMYVLGQTEQSGAEQNCLADPTFDKSIHGEVGKAVGKVVRKIIRMTVGNA